MTSSVLIRPLQASDSITELTLLLHSAYARLARMGLRYMATHQSEAVTLDRIAQGSCLVAILDEKPCGTILYRSAAQTCGCPWYDRRNVASLGQFAVDPAIQAKGIGRQLHKSVETMAAADHAGEIALDTAEPATHLVEWYKRLGYRFVEYARWSHTKYRSVILSKSLSVPETGMS